jgi:hypothetical protein
VPARFASAAPEQRTRDPARSPRRHRAPALGTGPGALALDQRCTLGISRNAWVDIPAPVSSRFVGQAFLYNAVIFTQALVLVRFFKIEGQNAGLYIVPLALGNFLGPALLGRLFDPVGRRTMITLSYIVSGVALVVPAVLFQAEAATTSARRS